MTYSEALDYLYGFIDYEKTSRYAYDAEALNLDRMSGLLDRLGNPHQQPRCVHIAGTNGKGSTAAMIASMLRVAGHRVGLYTSPHLVTFRERIRVDGQAISRRSVCALVEQLQRVIGYPRQNREVGQFTFFEVWTALAFLYFAAQAADLLALEVGMGGRLDATNVVQPLVAVITPVALDHTHKLGHSPAEIAGEKAGIIKPKGTVITATQTPEVLEVIRRVCSEREARCVEIGRDVTYEQVSSSDQGQTVTVEALGEVHRDLFVPLLGSHQAMNAAVAVSTVVLLGQLGVHTSADAVRDGLRRVQWPGRLQVVAHRPRIVLDGACNVHGAEQVRNAIGELFDFGKLILVMGICGDKDVRGVFGAFEPLAGTVVFTQADNPRALSPACISEQVGPTRANVTQADTVAKAIDRARSLARPEDLILVTGSLYVVGEAMSHLGLRADNI